MKPAEIVLKAVAAWGDTLPEGDPDMWGIEARERLAEAYGAGEVEAVLEKTRAFLNTDRGLSRLLLLSGLGNHVDIVLPLCRAAMMQTAPASTKSP